MKVYRKVHPYEKKNPEIGSVDVVKTFKNHTQALSLFSMGTVAAVLVYVFFFSSYYPATDISIFVVCPLVALAGIAVLQPMKVFLSKLFKDPKAGVFIMSFLIAGPFIVSSTLFLNTLYTFSPSTETIRINSFESHTTRSRRGGGYTNYILYLAEDKFKYQIGFRTSPTPPNGAYAVYRFRRGILGLRIIDGWYYSDKNEAAY